MELSSKNKQVQNGHDKKPDSNFEKAVEDSRKKIRATSRIEPKVKPRGRPRKDGGERPRPVSDETQGPQKVTASPPPDISEYLKVPLIALSQIPAATNKIPELALTSDEAGAVAQSFNKILEAFIPDVSAMSPKAAAIISASVVVGAIGFQKYQIYAAVTHQRAMEAAKQPEPPPQPNETHAASPDSYFKRQSV